jgi:leucyl-tRNA synthetase
MGEAIQLLTRVLTPFAPHFADAVAEVYGPAGSPSTVTQGWPSYDPALVVDEVLPYAVQVNGKLRGEIRIAADAGESEVRAAAESEEKVRAALAGKALRKVVFVPKRLINFVVG